MTEVVDDANYDLLVRAIYSKKRWRCTCPKHPGFAPKSGSGWRLEVEGGLSTFICGRKRAKAKGITVHRG